MNRYQSIAEVEQALEPYVSAASAQTSRGLTIDRTLRLAQLVGNPQDDLKVVHIAGTSGKTSTSYYVANLLARSGKKVGLTVSPHMDSITERVQIDGRPLSKVTFCEYFSLFLELVEALDELPTYFELMMVFAYWVFRKEGVDYAVVETGLGGLHDSSNIASRVDKMCVLTDIGLDHMHVLGSSIEAIAAQKVGIVKPHNDLVMYRQSTAVMVTVKEYVAAQHGALKEVTPQTDEIFQERNWRLAHNVYELLRQRDGLSQLAGDEIEQSKRLHVPGRMDIFERQGKTIVLDGAHNEQKMSAFLKSLTTRFLDTKFSLLIAMKQGKDLEYLAPLLAPHVTEVVACELSGSQDTSLRSVPADEIVKTFKDRGMNSVSSVKTSKEAVEVLLESSENLVVVTGSLYLVAEVRKLLQISS